MHVLKASDFNKKKNVFSKSMHLALFFAQRCWMTLEDHEYCEQLHEQLLWWFCIIFLSFLELDHLATICFVMHSA